MPEHGKINTGHPRPYSTDELQNGPLVERNLQEISVLTPRDNTVATF